MLHPDLRDLSREPCKNEPPRDTPHISGIYINLDRGYQMILKFQIYGLYAQITF